jgi:acyl-coenzyme A thioesterase PaaI-like protein
MKTAMNPQPKAALPGVCIEHSNCFGCSPNNPFGLALSMQRVDDGLVSTFRLSERFESYPGIIHGGIVSTIFDEVMGNVIAILDEKLCFAITVRVKYLTPLHTNALYRCVAKLKRRPDADDADNDIYKVDGEIHPVDRDEALAIASGTYKWVTVDQVTTEMSVMPSAFGRYLSYLKPRA